MKVVLATTNPGKIREIKSMLDGIDIIGLDELNVTMPEENGETIEANAVIKSVSVFSQTGLPTLAEDSGLCIDSLNGEPGVHSARYAGSTQENIARVLDKMAGIQNRDAHFETIFSFTDNDGTNIFKGQQHGRIGFEPRGANGFGYDPIFLNELGKSNAECTMEEKNSISARGKALRAFADWFRLARKI